MLINPNRLMNRLHVSLKPSTISGTKLKIAFCILCFTFSLMIGQASFANEPQDVCDRLPKLSACSNLEFDFGLEDAKPLLFNYITDIPIDSIAEVTSNILSNSETNQTEPFFQPIFDMAYSAVHNSDYDPYQRYLAAKRLGRLSIQNQDFTKAKSLLDLRLALNQARHADSEGKLPLWVHANYDTQVGKDVYSIQKELAFEYADLGEIEKAILVFPFAESNKAEVLDRTLNIAEIHYRARNYQGVIDTLNEISWETAETDDPSYYSNQLYRKNLLFLKSNIALNLDLTSAKLAYENTASCDQNIQCEAYPFVK